MVISTSIGVIRIVTLVIAVISRFNDLLSGPYNVKPYALHP